jgi:hypothetical protein
MSSVAKALPVLLVTLMIVLAGCGAEPGTGVTLEYEGYLEPADPGFRMEGYIEVDGGLSPQDTFRDVIVCLYSEDGELLHSQNLGELDIDSEVNVSISRTTTPRYVIIDTTALDGEDIGTEYYELVGEENYYRGYLIGSSEEFPTAGCA